jgi:hypothetical protein
MTTGFPRMEKYDMQIHIKFKKEKKKIEKSCRKHEGKFQYLLTTTNRNRILRSELRWEICNSNPLNASDDVKKHVFLTKVTYKNISGHKDVNVYANVAVTL